MVIIPSKQDGRDIWQKKPLPLVELEMISQIFDLVRFGKQNDCKYPPKYYL